MRVGKLSRVTLEKLGSGEGKGLPPRPSGMMLRRPAKIS